MAVQWLLVCHGLTTLLVLVSFLCGHWTIFEGTFIQRINNFLAYEFYDYLLRFANAVGGSRCSNAILGIENLCCNRPNPLLQLLYLGIIGGTYFLIAKTSFSYIPGYYLSEVHRSTSMLAVGVGIVLFLLTSFSDPGTVNEENVSNYLSAYPYDNIIYTKKECQTCKILKPARSKHCSICDRCVARFDHHCGWMNNCIGEKNTRYFLAFLLWHLLLCIYGTVTLGLILTGQMKEFRIVYILTVYYGIENSFFSLAPDVIQWLLGSYNNQVLIMVFLAIVALLLGGFLGYHVKLCLTNTTTNETIKWQDYINWQRKADEAKASAQALKESIKAMSAETKPPKSKWRALCSRAPLEDATHVVPKNMYNKGLVNNFLEIFFPMSTRWSFWKTKLKSS